MSCVACNGPLTVTSTERVNQTTEREVRVCETCGLAHRFVWFFHAEQEMLMITSVKLWSDGEWMDPIEVLT